MIINEFIINNKNKKVIKIRAYLQNERNKINQNEQNNFAVLLYYY